MPPIRTPIRSRAATPHGDGKRNLVLVHTEALQERRDFEEIAALVERRAPNIVVTIVNSDWPFPGIERKLAERPSLIFSPVIPMRFDPLRGRVYFGRSLSKIQEYGALRAAGISTPQTALLKPGFVADPKLFGDFIVLKPNDGETSYGKGVQLMRTARVRYIAPEDYPEDHPGRHFNMVAQRFIDTGPRPSHWRVLSLFGEPLYSIRHELVDERASLDAPDETLEATTIATNGGRRVRALAVDPEVIALARKVYQAVPGAAVQGTDIVRDSNGELFVLELNAGGATWHFSSAHGLELRIAMATAAGATDNLSEIGRRILIDQFDAFETTARLLVERTNREAK